MEHRWGNRDTARPSHRLRVGALAATAALVASGTVLGISAPGADAADRNATLTATGLVSPTYPTGGNTVWVQPGTNLTLDSKLLKVDLSKSVLGAVGNVLGNLLGGLVGLQAKVDLSSVHKGTVVLGAGSGQSVTTAALPRGVYPFTWTFTAVTTNLLGQRQSVALNGNQLSGIGLKLNAKNQYFGYIVSDTKSPCAGATCISLQTPKLSVAPSAPVVGQLPTVSVPGANVNVPLPSVPGVNAPVPGSSGSTAPTTGGAKPGSTATKPGSGTSTSATNPYGYTAPGCTGPCAVVPKGGGGGGAVGGAYGVTLGELGDPAGAAGAIAGTSSADAAAAVKAGGNPLGNGSGGLAADNAFDGTGARGSTAPALPTTLAIVAGAAFVGAAGLWFARRRAAHG